MARNVKLSRIAKLTLQFLKHNGAYEAYYNDFRTSRYKKRYFYVKNGYLKFLRERIENDGWYFSLHGDI